MAIIPGTLGNDVLDGTESGDLITGLSGDDTINANGGNDDVSGGSGNDTIVGGTGADTLAGNLGADLIYGNNATTWYDGVRDTIDGGEGNDIVYSAYGDSLNGNIGYDILNLSLENATSGVTIDFRPMTQGVLQLVNGVLVTVFQVLNLAGGTISNFEAVGTIIGSQFDDSLILANQNSAAASVSAGSGNDNVQTGSGDDQIDGGAGADTMAGGAGNDSYRVDNAGDVVIENAGEGTDTVTATVDYTLSANVEALVLAGSATSGTGNAAANTITGNAGDNSLSGAAGNDTLDGGAGNDTLDGGTGADAMSGGTGDDTYYVDNAGDTVSETPDGGDNDTIVTSVDYALVDNVENLILTGGAVNATGNDRANTLNGNDGANTLSGEGGDDTLNGGGGDDTLEGGTGADTLDGGTGTDTLRGGTGDDTYYVDSPEDDVEEDVDSGYDRVIASTSYALSDNVEALTLTGTAQQGTGNALDNDIEGNDADNLLYGLDGDDTLAGGGGNDLLDGGAGSDTMDGGDGDDTYYVADAGDVVSEGVDGGNDTVIASFDYTLGDNVEALDLGAGAANGTGNAADNRITGNGGDNTLMGMAGNDTLEGGVGEDTLDGGTGADIMRGGAGNDIYYVDDSGDVVEEAVGEGDDHVYASTDYTMDANVERLSLLAGAAIGIGNGGDNTIEGNGGANTLQGRDGNDVLDGGNGDDQLDGGDGDDRLIGGGGADTMTGGNGNDVYLVDDAGDQVVEAINGGNDRVISNIDYTLGDFVEYLRLTGDAVVGRGNALENIIDGSAGDNEIYGLEGNDTLSGGDGNDIIDGGAEIDLLDGGNGDDTYYVDNDKDVIVEAVNAGYDRVFATSSYMLSANLEELDLLGTGELARGNALNNILRGNALDNRVYGAEGDDRLYGGAGQDRLDGGVGADELNAGDGDDTLLARDGLDVLRGNAGNDTYYVYAAGSTLVEAVDEGQDIVFSRVDLTLANNIEELRLQAGAFNGTGNALSNVIYSANVASTLIGLDGDDILRSLGGRDVLNGGAGNDRLDGGKSRDFLTGGTGRDLFLFDAGDAPATSANADVITDFTRAEDDRIVLRTIDAIAGAADDAFTFIGNAAFGGVAGQLRYQVAGADVLVAGDTNGDSVADFMIRVQNMTMMEAGDFVL